jgi:hypothetical protein
MKVFITTIYPLFEITAVATHFWTVVVAFKAGGFFAAVTSFLLPVLSEIYWIVKMFGINDVFVFVALLHLLLAVPVSRARNCVPY